MMKPPATISFILKMLAVLFHGYVALKLSYFMVEWWKYETGYKIQEWRIDYVYLSDYVYVMGILFAAMLFFIQCRLRYFSLSLLAQGVLSAFVCLGAGTFFVHLLSGPYMLLVLKLMTSNYLKYFTETNGGK